MVIWLTTNIINVGCGLHAVVNPNPKNLQFYFFLSIFSAIIANKLHILCCSSIWSGCRACNIAAQQVAQQGGDCSLIGAIGKRRRVSYGFAPHRFIVSILEC